MWCLLCKTAICLLSVWFRILSCRYAMSKQSWEISQWETYNRYTAWRDICFTIFTYWTNAVPTDLQDVSKIRITGFRLDINGSSVEDIESEVSKIWIISINLSFHWQTFGFCSFIGNEYGFLWLVWTHQIMMNGFTNDSFPRRMHTTKNRYSVGTTETW